MTFQWDAANLDPIARHSISPPDEVEQVLTNNPLDLERQLRNGERRTPHLGITDAGRILFVVTTERAGQIRVVTPFPADAKAQKFFST